MFTGKTVSYEPFIYQNCVIRFKGSKNRMLTSLGDMADIKVGLLA
jgi:hypothetical protein